MSTPNNPLVSTIIPVFNRRTLLRQSVESVLTQTYRPIEIIVVDDGSDPEYKDFYAALENEVEEMTLLSQHNTGPGGARELGRMHANGEFIQYLDSDDLLCRNKFRFQVDALLANPNSIASYGPCFEYEAKNKELAESDFRSIEALTPMRITGQAQDGLFHELLKARWWITSAPLYRSSILEKAGPWSLLINEEDWEYGARIASYAGELSFVNTPASIRLIHDDHLSSEGSVNPDKLKSRASARESIFESAIKFQNQTGSTPIPKEYWVIFGRYTFLLARQCAALGLRDEYQRLFDLSIKAHGKRTMQHIVFAKAVTLLGLNNAAAVLRLLGK